MTAARLPASRPQPWPAAHVHLHPRRACHVDQPGRHQGAPGRVRIQWSTVRVGTGNQRRAASRGARDANTCAWSGRWASSCAAGLCCRITPSWTRLLPCAWTVCSPQGYKSRSGFAGFRRFFPFRTNDRNKFYRLFFEFFRLEFRISKTKHEKIY